MSKFDFFADNTIKVFNRPEMMLSVLIASLEKNGAGNISKLRCDLDGIVLESIGISYLNESDVSVMEISFDLLTTPGFTLLGLKKAIKKYGDSPVVIRVRQSTFLKFNIKAIDYDHVRMPEIIFAI